MQAQAITPFYTDWTFWSAAVAFVAIVLSQIPPLHLLLKPRRVEVEVNSRIQITHKVGNPNVGLHVSIANRGGRNLRIRSLGLTISREGKHLISMPAQNYFEKQSDTSSVLFVPFSLAAGEHWSHGVNFLNFFDRPTEKFYRASEAALRSDIHEKLKNKNRDSQELATAEPDLSEPFVQLFSRLFIWEPGEYVVELIVETEPASATYTKKYRFTLYESDTEELKKHIDDYKYGGGIYFNVESHVGAFVPLSEHLG